MNKFKLNRKEITSIIDEEFNNFVEENKDNPCWKNYEMVGTKTKNGKEVPKNSIGEEQTSYCKRCGGPLEEVEEIEEGGKCTGPTKKTSSTSKGKKYMKCIKNPDGKGYIRKHWGQKGARAAPKGSKRNKSFNARHDCKNAKAGTARKLACDDW